MMQALGTPLVVIVVPNGSQRAEPLARAVQRIHPTWEVAALWAGDPHLRPALDGVEWLPTDDFDPGWQRTLIALPGERAEWWRLLTWRVALSDTRPVVALWAGAIAVLGPLDSLVDHTGVSIGVRLIDRSAIDAAASTDEELFERGCWSPRVIGLSSAAAPLVDWLVAALGATDVPVGRLLERAADLGLLHPCADDAIGAGVWRWPGEAPRLLDLPDFDTRQPWVLDPQRSQRQRIAVVGNPGVEAAVNDAAGQLLGERATVAAPGGIVVDDTIRALVRAGGPEVPPPFTAPSAFRSWLASRYWATLHRDRRDLAAAFPHAMSTDAARFETWCRRAAIDDAAALVLPVAPPPDRWSVAQAKRPGINCVGYFTKESSLGDVVRRLDSALETAGVQRTQLAVQRTDSPVVVAAAQQTSTPTIAYETTIAVVNADQFFALHLDHPELFGAGTHLVGYWFWELDVIPGHMRAALDDVDEVWAGSRFVADAFREVTDLPVRHVPIPVPEPVASQRSRSDFPPLAAVADRCVFLVVFDHFSVTARKNPVGAIEAFRRAFAPDEGPVLVVKSMNGDRRWPQHQQLHAAAAGRADIVIWDEHLERADHMALIASADVLVSLHRSEGLGLHLAEAMWLGTPVIATRYSGNLDFMDDDNSLLVDATLVPVRGGEGVYPESARWAEPDLDQAVAAMRRLWSDTEFRSELAAAARATMERQPTLDETGCLIADLLGVQRTADRGPGVAS